MSDKECKTFRNASGRSLHDSISTKNHDITVRRYLGEYMYEKDEINIKLLYIPLIQLSVEKQRITTPLFDDYSRDYCD